MQGTDAATTFRPRGLLNPDHDEVREPLETQRTSIYWANPYRKRVSEYEKVLLYAQPNPDWIPGGLGLGGWTSNFAGGRAPWENYFTDAKCSDWFAFRDPSGRWQFPYVSEKAEDWRETQRFVSAFTAEQLYRDIDPEWLDLVASHLGALAHHEYGLYMAHAGIIRDTFTDVLRVAGVTGGLDHLDTSQMIQAEKVYFAQVVEGFSEDVAPAKAAWLTDPVFRGARTAVEKIWAESYDPIETLFAIYMVYDPLFGRFARSEYFYRLAGLSNDHFTPWTMWFSVKADGTERIWALELFKRVLAGDPKFGEYNQKLMRLWVEKWYPLALAAMSDFAPMWQRTSRLRQALGVDSCESAATRVIADWQETYTPVFGFSVDPATDAKSVANAEFAMRATDGSAGVRKELRR